MESKGINHRTEIRGTITEVAVVIIGKDELIKHGVQCRTGSQCINKQRNQKLIGSFIAPSSTL